MTELRCAATKTWLQGGVKRCPRPRWKAHVTHYCYQHAISLGEAKVVDQAAIDLMIDSERRNLVRSIRTRMLEEGHPPPCIDILDEWDGGGYRQEEIEAADMQTRILTG